MKLSRTTWLVGATLVASGCVGVGGSASPVTVGQATSPSANPCASAATLYDGQATASFVTTVGAVRALVTREMSPATVAGERWPGVADDHPAVLCYIEGQLPISRPAIPGATPAVPFERMALVVIDGQPEPLFGGSPDQIPMTAP